MPTIEEIRTHLLSDNHQGIIITRGESTLPASWGVVKGVTSKPIKNGRPNAIIKGLSVICSGNSSEYFLPDEEEVGWPTPTELKKIIDSYDYYQIMAYSGIREIA